MRKVTLLSVLYTKPGNVAGSYSEFFSSKAILSISSLASTFVDATMFWTSITGALTAMPMPFSSFSMLAMAAFASFSDAAPVHVALPEENMRKLAFGLFMRKTTPGKLSGKYSASGSLLASLSRSILSANWTVITMLWISIFSIN
jgi:hypothetical protein